MHSWVRIIKTDLFSCVKHSDTPSRQLGYIYIYICKKHVMQHMEYVPKCSGKTSGWLSREYLFWTHAQLEKGKVKSVLKA